MFVKLTIGAIYNTPEPTFDNATLMVDGSTQFSYVNVECNGDEEAFDDCSHPRYFFILGSKFKYQSYISYHDSRR